MAGPANGAPVIIKRKKTIVDGGHSGGAWKIAYADFATAMMAFFMLMWLISATTEEQRKGIADYFNPTVFVSKAPWAGMGSLRATLCANKKQPTHWATGKPCLFQKNAMTLQTRTPI
jgi:chemotaxis protein MotB